MKHSEAARHLEVLMMVLQKFRSNLEEEFIQDNPVAKKVVDDLEPWVTGDACPLPAIVTSLERYEKTDRIDGLFFHNMMMVVHRLQPSLKFVAGVLYDHEFPEPDLSFMFMEDG